MPPLAALAALQLLAVLSPGPDVIAVMQTAARSRQARVWAALGMAAGNAVWAAAALLGLGLLLQAVPALALALRVLGGLYLIWMGARMWQLSLRPAPAAPIPTPAPTSATDWQAFRRGLLTNLANAKAAIYYTSIFASLLDPALPLLSRLAAFGTVMLVTTAFFVGAALLLSSPGPQRVYAGAAARLDRLGSTVMLGFGTFLLLEH